MDDNTLKAAIRAIMDDTEVPPNKRLDRLTTFLKENGLAYSTMLCPNDFLVHPHNRGGAMINALDVHDKGQKILELGFRRSLLTDSICFELSPHETQRRVQVEANEALVQKSSGLLAPLQGSERYMTVSSSHTTAFLKASQHRCKRPGAAGGFLNLEDEALKEAVSKGWPWLVLSWRAEFLVPTLPAFVQMVLNSVHSVGLGIQEMEAAQQVALLVSSGQSFKDAVQSVKASRPACHSYMDFVGLYVQKFGGGPDFPLISFLSDFCKELSITVCIGEELFKAVTSWDLQEPSTQFPFLRASLLACQLTSPKIVDGTARLLLKSDLDRLKGANVRQNLLQAEQMVAHAYQVYVDSGKTTVVQRALGLMMVRLSLILVKKEKLGREKLEVYRSPEHVAQLFATEATNSAASASAAKADGKDSEEEPALDLLGALSVGEQALLQNKHLKKDGRYVHADYPEKIFVFTGLENDEAQFVHTPLYGSPETVLVPPDLFRKWKATRLPLPRVLAKDAAEGLMYGKSSVLAEAELLAEAQQMLFKLYQDHNSGDSAALDIVTPTNIYTSISFPAHKLKLVPLAILSKPKDASKLTLFVEWKGAKFQLSPWPQLKDFDETIALSRPKSTEVIVPFYFVKTTSKEEDVSMTISWKTLDGMKLPMLTNVKKLSAQTILLQASKDLLEKKDGFAVWAFGLMVTIGTSTSLTWRDRQIVVPPELIVSIGELNYLKVQPSNRTLMKLLLGARTAGSLTSSPGLQQLRQGREDAIAKAIKEESKEKGSGADDLFTEPKIKKPTKLASTTLEFVMVDGLQIGLQQKHKASTDLLVLMESDTLDKVFTKITEDADPEEKRRYKRRRVAEKKENSDEPSEHSD
ncbi:unnamed protein product [Symbiodinium sp. CCMP2592]|nr:unnamed protein product [Symbiodinium sp. CCMP2592]